MRSIRCGSSRIQENYTIILKSPNFSLITKIKSFDFSTIHKAIPHQKLKSNKYTEEDIIKVLEFLIDNIFVVFTGKVFRQIIGIPMDTTCVLLLADIFLYSYEAEFIQSLLLVVGKQHLSSTSHIITSMTYCQLITKTL